MKITAYCMEWHLTKSDAFKDMLVEVLADYADIELKAWDGEHLPEKLATDRPTIFCMLPPTAEAINQVGSKIVWLPMWDQTRGFPEDWWNQFAAPNIRIVCFSKVVTRLATKAKATILELTYFKDPDQLTPVNWHDGNILFYWNRTGLVGPKFLEELSLATKAKEILFLEDIDYSADKKYYYKLPKEVGNTKNVKSLKLGDRDTFLKQTEAANIVIAPRISEGVGMTFLEAMARGCFVIAYDGPTMNEYIVSGQNGLLLKEDKEGFRLVNKITNKLGITQKEFLYTISNQQDWRSIRRLDWQTIGQKARADHYKGYEQWLADTQKYADFVLKW